MQTFLKSKFRAVAAALFVVVILFASCEKSDDEKYQETPVFTAFSFEKQAGEVQIDTDKRSIKATAKCGTNLAGIVPMFTVSPGGARAKVKSVWQTSGQTDVDFSEGPVIYTLTTADGNATVEWEVTVALHDDCKPKWEVNLQKRSTSGVAEKFMEKWHPSETAIIVIDMWPDQTWDKCAHNSIREKDMSLAMNDVFDIAREKGMLIVFAPSGDAEEFDKWYGHLPARNVSAKYRHGYGNPAHWDFWWHGAGGEREQSGLAFPGEKGSFGFPQESGRGCDYRVTATAPPPPQIPELKIGDRDIITDDFIEMIGGKGYSGRVYDDCLFKERGIKNVILTGCHTDICIIGRPFGCRALVMAGYNVVLCRDLTNCTFNCNHFEKNGRSHVEMLEKVCNYVETWICPSITSTEITGKPAFEFDEAKIQRMFPPK